MVAFIRHASVPCAGAVPDMWAFDALALLVRSKLPIGDEEVQTKEKDIVQYRQRLGLQKWCKLYAIEMGEAHAIVGLIPD
jgi:hypothetical protein